MVTFSSTQPAGTEIKFVEASGKTVISHAPAKEFQTIVFSSADLKSGETYKILSNDSELTEVTLSENIMSISDTGETVTGGFGGVGGMPGGQKPGKRP